MSIGSWNVKGVAVGVLSLALASNAAATSTQRYQHRHSDGQRELAIGQEWTVAEGGTLTVNVPDADVNVRTGSGAEARVEVFFTSRDLAWAREVVERMRFDVSRRGSDVHIVASPVRISHGDWRQHHSLRLVVEVRVPERYNARISTADGDIMVTRLEGRAHLRTADGDIVLGVLRGSEISAETSDGDIDAEELSGGLVELLSDDGDLRIDAVSGEVRARTGDGDVTLRLVEPAGVSVHTGDGDITLYASAALRAEVDFEAEDVRLAHELQLEGRMTRRAAAGRLNGGGPRLAARSGDGRIVLRTR